MGWIRGGVLAALLGLCAPYACSSDEAPGGASGAAGADGSTTPSYGQSACFSCAVQACDAERSACIADPGCTGYLGCIEACPVSAAGDLDASCEATCPRGETSAALVATSALAQCLGGAAASCSECGATDAGADSGNPVLNQQCSQITHSDECNECLWNNCCDSMDAVFGGGPATSLADCWLACTDSACEKACYEQYPEGVAEFGGWNACLTVKCMPGGECPPQNPCTACLAEQCPYTFADCESDVECHLTLQCIDWCPTTDCALACPDQHPAAKPKFEAHMACVAQRCATDCG